MKYRLLLGIIPILLAGPAMAVCSVPQPRLVCAEYFASKVVVEATLVKVRTIGDEDAYVYSLRVDRTIRGHIPGVFRVYEENNSGRAAFDWKIGRKYLLFLWHSGPEKSWEVDGCGNSGPLSRAKAVLEQINAIDTHSDGGVIHGRVSEYAAVVPVPVVRVEARGANGRYTATTNSQGDFEIRVPAGRYVLRAASFDTDPFSYENPRDLQIEPGGCVQVQLAPRSQP
jgi:hypothetical protein